MELLKSRLGKEPFGLKKKKNVKDVKKLKKNRKVTNIKQTN
jgi:hypothetical protein